MKEEFMKFAGEALGIQTWEDWYSITTSVFFPFFLFFLRDTQQLQQLGAHSLIDYYNHSISKAITSIFPQYDWKLWKFQMVPKHYWNNISHGR